MSKKNLHKRTAAVQASIGTDKSYGSVMPPIYLSSTFRLDGLDKRGRYEYSRTRNPTRDALADVMSELEGGIGACVTSSGMAALTLILHLLDPDDLVIAPYDCYGRSYALMKALGDKGHFKLKFADIYDESKLDGLFADKPRMVIIESPSNPVMRIADIEAITRRAKEHDAIVVCDNTFLSPILQQPIKLGADIVFHSTTKFLNGHSDVVGGVAITNKPVILEELEFWNNSLGTIGAPFDSYMTLRGIRTLEVRIRRGEENAAALVQYLNNHEAVSNVYYPGLASHTGHEIAKKQQDGFGAMISFELKGTYENVENFVKELNVLSLAQSLGGAESLINHPASMTHVSMGAKARAEAGVTDQLLRISTGIEHIDDLTADLEQAFENSSK